MFVELLQYNPSVDLHVALTLRLEFPGAGQAIAAVTISPFPLLRLSAGVTLQLLMMVSVGLPCTPCPLLGALGTLTQPGRCGLELLCLSPLLSPCLGGCQQSPHPLGAATLPQGHWVWALGAFRREWGAG